MRDITQDRFASLKTSGTCYINHECLFAANVISHLPRLKTHLDVADVRMCTSFRFRERLRIIWYLRLKHSKDGMMDPAP
jgi:hypothetical protein